MYEYKEKVIFMNNTATYEQIERLSEIYKQLSHPVRLQIVLFLQQGPACVSELCEVSGISQSATSQHLKQLRTARLIKQDRRAQQIYYSLADRHIQILLSNGLDHVKGAGCDETHTR